MYQDRGVKVLFAAIALISLLASAFIIYSSVKPGKKQREFSREKTAYNKVRMSWN